MKKKPKKKPAKMGRPPKRIRDRQTERIVARFTPSEYRQLKTEAKQAELKPATYLANLWREHGHEGGKK